MAGGDDSGIGFLLRNLRRSTRRSFGYVRSRLSEELKVIYTPRDLLADRVFDAELVPIKLDGVKARGARRLRQ